ncbi:hypothetical protein [Verrucomicrobium spinosum]|uniref:hypothetical protein n=1 Tax=Verrucomicrobium spinosum TaxID=2736 RepID=UPI00017450B2|nr:hypothetical protein [Verrucomicrobium spinosum]
MAKPTVRPANPTASRVHQTDHPNPPAAALPRIMVQAHQSLPSSWSSLLIQAGTTMPQLHD